jgi:hypothetical protein
MILGMMLDASSLGNPFAALTVVVAPVLEHDKP